MITEKDVANAKREADEAKQRFHEMARELAEHECPYKVGDIVVCLGHSHRGKKMKISSIGADFRFGQDVPRWRVRGPILKANGDPSKNEGDFGESHYRILQEKCDGDVEKFVAGGFWY